MASSSARWSNSRPPIDSGDLAVDIGDGLTDAFAAVAALVAVAQFQRFALAGRCARGHCGASERAIGKRDVDFDRGVAARVQDFAPVHAGNLHVMSPAERRYPPPRLSASAS